MRFAAALILFSLTLSHPAPAGADEHPRVSSPSSKTKPRYLIVAVCGVGYSLVQEMYERGELENFQRPSALVVSFPSLTSPSLSEILRPLGAPPAWGYEDYYFDPEQNQMRGGFFHRFSRSDFVNGSFREVFDYHPHPILMTLEYSIPVVSAWLAGRLTWRRIRKRFEQSEKTFYLAFLDAGDPLAHVGGQRFVRGLLKRIDREIPRLRRRADGPLEVVVFSDHGNAFRRYRRAPLARALKQSGFRLQKKLQGPRSVVFPQYGLVGSAVLYTQTGAESEVAEALRNVEGVALLAYRNGPAIVVESSSGSAQILRQGRFYCYQPQTGDPLELKGKLQQFESGGNRGADGCASDEAWWQATKDHVYPDPLRRLWSGFEETVAQPASLLISLKDGYYVGSRLLDIFAVLRATHGNLGREQSLGFVLTTAEPLPPFLRGDQLWETLTAQRPLPLSTRPWEPLPASVLLLRVDLPAGGT